MSVPASVKWISPFRELMVKGFQSLPLTLIGTSGFFAANSTNPVFLYLTGILSVFIPIAVYSTQKSANFIESKYPDRLTGLLWNVVFGSFSLILLCISFAFNNTSALTQIISLIFIFLFNFSFGEKKSPINMPSSSACNLVTNIVSKDEVTNSPSYWLTQVMFLTIYVFRNALDNFNVVPNKSDDPLKVTRRKIQTTFAMIAIIVIGVLIVSIRFFYTGCENLMSLSSSFLLALFLSSVFYGIAKDSQIDLFGMFQNINFGCGTQNIKCVLSDE